MESTCTPHRYPRVPVHTHHTFNNEASSQGLSPHASQSKPEKAKAQTNTRALRLLYSKSVDIPTFIIWRWVFWALGVARQGHPRVSWEFGRWIAPRPPVSRRPGWYTTSRRRRRPRNRADERAEPPPTPKTPVRRQRGLDSAYILTTAERKKIFWALGV